jgi:translation initiation factor IF-1
MVKNTMGGCNGKKVAHKHAVKSTKSGLRISQNKSEIYGVVKRLNGNTFDVTCIDEKERRCFIRGKFKGRGKRDNIIEVDKWVLIGLREFQQVPSELVLVNGKKEMEMCDLLEVYSSSEKETLKRTHGVYMKESEISRSTAITASEETLQFVDMDTLRYQKIASQKVETIRLKAEQRKTSNNVVDQSAFYSDIDDSDGDDDDESDDDSGGGEDEETNKNNKNSSNKSKGEESKGEESKGEESKGEESKGEESEEEPQKQNTWNKNKRVYKEEIDVDDI